MNYAQITADNVRALLDRSHMSIRLLADEIHVSASTLTDALRSKRGMGIDSLIAVADYFGVGIEELCRVDLIQRLNEHSPAGPERICSDYEQLDVHGKELVELVMKKELERVRAQSDPN